MPKMSKKFQKYIDKCSKRSYSANRKAQNEQEGEEECSET